MPAQKSTSYFAGLALIAVMAAPTALRAQEPARPHDLRQIEEAAKAFVARENAAKGTSWRALEPNLKIVVPQCAVPLKTMWAPKSFRLSRPNVVVTCRKTIPGQWKPYWEVYVPAYERQ